MRNEWLTPWLRLVLIFFIITGCSNRSSDSEPVGIDNLAYKWGKVALEATANDTEWFRPRPTVTSRMLGLIWTAVFDAWTRYDSLATPVYLQNVDRRPAGEQTLKNKETAISYAAYRAMMVYFYSDSVMLTSKMKEFGFNPADSSLDPATAVGIGNLAAKAVVDARRNDGSNQFGNMEGCDSKGYSDYTSYKPVNPADTLNDVMRWQPKYFADGKGGKFCPSCLTPHWGKVVPLFLDSASQFRPPPPPAIGSQALAKDIEEVVYLQANLTDEQKGLIEFMRDGPKSVQQAGHWFIFAQDVSERDKHTLDQDVQMYFLVEAAAMDAFIACWDSKMVYDYARPYTLVHDYYKDRTITGWAGPEKGMVQMKGQEWRPYSPETFLCPPFPSYVSGHSTISGACAEILKLYKGDDHFGIEVKRTPGEMTEPNRLGKPVVLKFPTFTETAEMAGISRVMGGYHIQTENKEGLKLGRHVATIIWKKYLQHTGKNN
jgi:hypothetical protein